MNNLLIIRSVATKNIFNTYELVPISVNRNNCLNYIHIYVHIYILITILVIIIRYSAYIFFRIFKLYGTFVSDCRLKIIYYYILLFCSFYYFNCFCMNLISII